MQRFVHASAIALIVSFYSCPSCIADTLCYSSTFKLVRAIPRVRVRSFAVARYSLVSSNASDRN